jgi:hypothetical protein
VEAQSRAEARLEDVEGRLERLTLVVGELAAAQGRTETLLISALKSKPHSRIRGHTPG